jgi:hypothetical protein
MGRHPYITLFWDEWRTRSETLMAPGAIQIGFLSAFMRNPLLLNRPANSTPGRTAGLHRNSVSYNKPMRRNAQKCSRDVACAESRA